MHQASLGEACWGPSCSFRPAQGDMARKTPGAGYVWLFTNFKARDQVQTERWAQPTSAQPQSGNHIRKSRGAGLWRS